MAPEGNVVQRFQSGRSRAQYDRDTVALGAHQREVARRVAKAILLFERCVVFLIDHDQTRDFS